MCICMHYNRASATTCKISSNINYLCPSASVAKDPKEPKRPQHRQKPEATRLPCQDRVGVPHQCERELFFVTPKASIKEVTTFRLSRPGQRAGEVGGCFGELVGGVWWNCGFRLFLQNSSSP